MRQAARRFPCGLRSTAFLTTVRDCLSSVPPGPALLTPQKPGAIPAEAAFAAAAGPRRWPRSRSMLGRPS
eukprot:950088-Pyramimonas_sp.AAC.1